MLFRSVLLVAFSDNQRLQSSIDDIDSTLTTKKGNSSSFLGPSIARLLTWCVKFCSADAFNAVQHNCFRRSRLGDLWPLAELTENKNTAPMHVRPPVAGILLRT